MSVHPPEPSASKPVTLLQLADMRARGEPIAMLTCYDASFARLLDSCGVDCVLVGDSLGMVIQGHASTLPVTVEDVEYHVRAVARGTQRAWLIADMPFGSYQGTPQSAFDNAVRLMQAGAQMVKLEGGAWLAPTVEFLVARGVPVCAHLGLTPQSVHALGGYRIQGKSDDGGRPIAARCAGAANGRRVDAGARADSRGTRRPRDARAADSDDRHRRRRRLFRVRCWCCTTCSTYSPARSRASCATSWPVRRTSPPPCAAMCERSRSEPSPPPTAISY